MLSAIEAEWESIAGHILARRSKVLSYDDGILVVAVENRSVQQDMNFKKNTIIRAVSAKTSLQLRDIRTEIAPSVRAGSSGRAKATRARRKKMADSPASPEIDGLKEEILSQNPGLSEKIAFAIACCRR
jgi:hypothetical protein